MEVTIILIQTNIRLKLFIRLTATKGDFSDRRL